MSCGIHEALGELEGMVAKLEQLADTAGKRSAALAGQGEHDLSGWYEGLRQALIDLNAAGMNMHEDLDRALAKG